jgi:manganese oxidase
MHRSTAAGYILLFVLPLLVLPLLTAGCAPGEPQVAFEARVIEVAMRDDGGEMRFDPARVEVRRGDVVRFVQEGVMPHNVFFVRNNSPAGVELGDTWSGPFLNRKGETYDVVIDDRFIDGEYEYVCAPHIPNGMKGVIVVNGGSELANGTSDLANGDPELANGGGAEASTAPHLAREVPEIVGKHGLQPLPYEMDDGTKVFRLTVEEIRWETREGHLVDAKAYNRMIPGPLIRVREGDRVRIEVTNHLEEPHTTHWHGLFVPNDMDGVPGISQDPIQPGESFAYEFEAAPAGTRLYHSHFNAMTQEPTLHGMFVIEEQNPSPALQADREEIMLLADGPLGFVINGKEFPLIEPIQMKMGERVRVRVANLGSMYHPMHLHGGYFDVVAKDGFELPHPRRENTLSVAPGETWDLILHPQYAGVWIWHCHVLSHVTGPRDEAGHETAAGMIGLVIVDDGETVLADVSEHRHH